MSQNIPDYNLRVIRNLLKTAFDSVKLDAFCCDYYPDIYQQFAPEMQFDVKINILFGHIQKFPAKLENLLHLIREEEDEVFNQFKNHIRNQLVPKKEERTNTVTLLTELAEWKIVHNEVQEAIMALDQPVRWLTHYRFEKTPKTLDDAGRAWQRNCVPKLNKIKKWNIELIQITHLGQLNSCLLNVDSIIRQIMWVESQAEFRNINLWFH